MIQYNIIQYSNNDNTLLGRAQAVRSRQVGPGRDLGALLGGGSATLIIIIITILIIIISVLAVTINRV